MKTILTLIILSMWLPVLAQPQPAPVPPPAAPRPPLAPQQAPITPQQQPTIPNPDPNATAPNANHNQALPPQTIIVTNAGQPRFGLSNAPFVPTDTLGMPPTNAIGGGTNQIVSSNVLVVFSITNTLRTMAPNQAQMVRQVQAGLDELQRVAMTLRNSPNLQQTVDQNPTLQQQINFITDQIYGLAQGQVRPSQDLIRRLTQDLLRNYVVLRLTPDHQLVLSTVVNQIVNSENLAPAQVTQTINTAQVLLEGSGAPRAIVHPVTCDLHAIALELQPNLQQ